MQGSEGIYDMNGLFGSRSVIVLFGDSITQRGFDENGWASALCRHYSRKADIINRGYGGYNTRWGKVVMRSLFKMPSFLDMFSSHSNIIDKDKYLTAVIWFGANDAADENVGPHVPLIEYGNNLQEMVDHLRNFFIYIIVLTPPPVHGPSRLKFQLEQYGDKATGVQERSTESAGRYAAMARRIADANNVLFLDIWKLMLAEGEETWPGYVGAGMEGGDGLHLSPSGQQFVAKHLIDMLEAHTIPVDTLPQELPWGRDIDPKQHVSSLNRYQMRVENSKIGLGRNFVLMSSPAYSSGAIDYTVTALGVFSLAVILVGVVRVCTRGGTRHVWHTD